jgi:hypothetical protein
MRRITLIDEFELTHLSSILNPDGSLSTTISAGGRILKSHTVPAINSKSAAYIKWKRQHSSSLSDGLINEEINRNAIKRAKLAKLARLKQEKKKKI